MTTGAAAWLFEGSRVPRWPNAFVLIALLLFCASAEAQKPLPTGSVALPPGHVPIAPTTAELPAEHPPIEKPAEQPNAPAQRRAEPPADLSVPSPEVPAGTVDVTVVDAQQKPQAGVEVRLGILRQTIAEGESRQSQTARTNANGGVRFSGLKLESDFSYRVTIPRGRATYATAPFQLKGEQGQSVLLHLFPVTDDINAALVGMRGIIVIEPKDDVFQIEVMFRVFNIGSITWVPSNLVLDLPEGSKGFTAQESMNDTRFVSAEEDSGARLEGTFAPGQHDTSFRFQVPNDGKPAVDFHMELPPHVAEVRVIAQSAPGMTLNVDGFDAAESANDANGQRMLVTARQLRQGDPQIRELNISLGGMPTPGPGQWIALGIALAIALTGVAAAAKQGSSEPRRLPQGDVMRARDLLVEELVQLEHAKSSAQVGPLTYESTRRLLFDALVRLQAGEARGAAVVHKSLLVSS